MNVDVRVEVNLKYFYGLFFKNENFFCFYVCAAQAMESWEMKVLKKGCVRKLVVKPDPFYKQIAGGPRPLVTQRCLEKCQSHESSVWNTSSPSHMH